MKHKYNNVCIDKNTPLVKAIKIMDEGTLGIVFIIENDGKLLGVLTDIDLRSAFLNAKPLNLSVENYMNKNPITISQRSSNEDLIKIKNKWPNKRIIPVLDDEGRITGIEITRMANTAYTNPVVILAGGLGKRLRPLTEKKPKPMLTIKNVPLLEITIKSLKEQGFKNIYISVNYQGEQIKNYFGNGSNLNTNIRYLEEKSPLGTAGPLALMKNIDEPCIVINGDILTKVDYRKLLDYHLGHEKKCTVALYQYDFQVPYGVANIGNGKLIGIEEKPIKKFFINAGMYVIDPEIISLIPENKMYDMTDLIDDSLKRDIPIGCFPLREYWIDVGNHSEYHKANEDYDQIF